VLIKQHGVQVRKFDDALLRGFGAAAKDVVAEIAAKDPFTKKVYDNYMTALRKAIGWSSLGEQGYMNARSLLNV
jgi:TRAP-type mannitol/chloroaromatic compound transport system substrate-binding protein